MGLFSKIFGIFKKKESVDIVNTEKKSTENATIFSHTKNVDSYTDIWHYIKPKENTQAYHVLSVIGFEDWIDMEDIRKKIKDGFFIEYQHEKSLYPYIKTLVDIGLLETNSVGGKRKWKKKELVITTPVYLPNKEK